MATAATLSPDTQTLVAPVIATTVAASLRSPRWLVVLRGRVRASASYGAGGGAAHFVFDIAAGLAVTVLGWLVARALARPQRPNPRAGARPWLRGAPA